ncbi:MAG TPA: branched-chain amino acid ABC transporter permease [Symbiobacteriaceae bacterium]|jgi:branched-chain amino acid transport system permease protein
MGTPQLTLPLFITMILNGLAIGMLYFLVAVGLSVIFGLMHVLNFAHGSMSMVGAYVGLTVLRLFGNPAVGTAPSWAFAIAIVAGGGAGFLLGWLTERFLVRPLYKRPLFLVLLTLGLILVLDESVKIIWTANPQGLVIVPALAGTVSVLGQPFAIYRVFLIVFGLTMIVLTWWAVNRTRVGIIIRAGVQDSDMVQTLGINVRQVFSLVFAMGVGLAAMGGIATAPFNGVYPGMGGEFLLKAFIVVVIGGFGSTVGTALGATVLGLTEQFLPWFFPKFAAVAPMAVMVLVLLLRPEGLFSFSGRRAG